MQLQKMLEELGLTSNEITVYMALLNYGGASGAELLQLTELEKSSLYKALNGLISQKFVTTTGSLRKQHFYPVSHNIVLMEFDKRIASIEQAKNTFSTFASKLEKYTAEAYKGDNVKIFTGEKAIYNHHKELLDKKITMLRTIASSQVSHKIGASYENVKKVNEWFIPQRVARNIAIRVLYGKDDEPDEFDVSNASLLKECRSYPKPLDLPSTLTVADNLVAFSTLKRGKFWGIVIKDKLIAQLLITIYDSLWEYGTTR